jgi:hypothetical protein
VVAARWKKRNINERQPGNTTPTHCPFAGNTTHRAFSNPIRYNDPASRSARRQNGNEQYIVLAARMAMDRKRTKSSQARTKIEFGDFQTSRELAARIVHRLRLRGIHPRTILEPTCGLGSLLLAAADGFPDADRVLGVDINAAYLRRLKQIIQERNDGLRFQLRCDDVLQQDSPLMSLTLPQPWLVIGNPPWVTNSGLGSLSSNNLPAKRNDNGATGVEARTGQSNFDISEWILRRIVSLLHGRRATMAMLCKTTVARKVLAYAWKSQLDLSSAQMFLIDADQEFSATVDACLFVCEFGEGPRCLEAEVYASIESDCSVSRIAWRNGDLIADSQKFDQWQHLQASDVGKQAKWRSGVKHDCAAVLELEQQDGKYRNRAGQLVELESQQVYPLLKSSDLAHDESPRPRRWLLMPQTRLNEDPQTIRKTAPRTWQYLERHAEQFDRRRSSIYRDRPRYSIFGVGDYTFARWKVAVAGFYKKLNFKVVGPYTRRPVLFDDTCYFLPCRDRRETERLCAALNSDAAREFYSAFVFWDAKRPITAKLLQQLDLPRLLSAVGH